MDKSSSLSNTVSILLPKIKRLWRSGNAHLQTIFSSVKTQAKFAAETLALILSFILKQLNRLIDYLAQHPLLDKTEALYCCLLYTSDAADDLLQV